MYTIIPYLWFKGDPIKHIDESIIPVRLNIVSAEEYVGEIE